MKKKIVIIDDDDHLVSMLTTILENEGYVVRSYSQTVFIDILEKERFDVLLLDVWFDTYRAGIQMAQAIRQRARTMNKPVIMMSSDANLEEYARSAGITNYLNKPLDMDIMLHVVKNLSSTPN